MLVVLATGSNIYPGFVTGIMTVAQQNNCYVRVCCPNNYVTLNLVIGNDIKNMEVYSCVCLWMVAFQLLNGCLIDLPIDSLEEEAGYVNTEIDFPTL